MSTRELMPVTPSAGRTWSLARRVLGLRRRTRVGPAVYVERDATSLSVCLAAGKTKLYDVHFDHAPPVRIRVSAARPYPDLTGPQSFEPYLVLADQITPGMRVLDARGASGAGAAWLAERVGPSGAIVALDTDHEFIRFARRRYRADHLAFELGATDSLGGELDGSFNAVVNFATETIEPAALSEWWRIIAPGGILALLLPAGDESQPGSTLSERTARDLRTLPGPYRLERHAPAGLELAALILRKPSKPTPSPAT